MQKEDREATQEHAIFGVLITYCGQMLTPDTVDAMMRAIRAEMRSGPCAWAFANTEDA